MREDGLMNLELAFTFDDKTYRHFLNGHATVLHCHHYMSLTTQLAIRYADWGGPRILRECAEDSILPMLQSYIREKGVSGATERLLVGCAYYSAMGLGRMEASGGSQGGEARLTRSHVDEGWVKKFRTSTDPINHFTAGYVAAMFSAAFERPARAFRAMETHSMATGDSSTTFEIAAT
jgi:hypothetical protein